MKLSPLLRISSSTCTGMQSTRRNRPQRKGHTETRQAPGFVFAYCLLFFSWKTNALSCWSQREAPRKENKSLRGRTCFRRARPQGQNDTRLDGRHLGLRRGKPKAKRNRRQPKAKDATGNQMHPKETKEKKEKAPGQTKETVYELHPPWGFGFEAARSRLAAHGRDAKTQAKHQVSD